MSKGIFITLEGADGTGKSTQINFIADYFKAKGYEVVLTREPGGSELGETLRNMLLAVDFDVDTVAETLLYLAARADHVAKIIKPALNAGKVVICDRFAESTYVYQGFVKNRDIKQLKAMNDFAVQGIKPDLTLLLDGDPVVLEKRRVLRAVNDRFEKQGLQLQLVVREGFLKLHALPENTHIKLVDALQTQAQVSSCISRFLAELITE